MNQDNRITDINKVLDVITTEELDKANKLFPQFQSRHESYAVIREEFEEAMDELQKLCNGIENYWKACRYDKQYNADDTIRLLTYMETNCIHGVKELIQTAAMIRKAKYVEERK